MSWSFVVVLTLAMVLYGVMSMSVATARSSDLAGNGMATAFVMIFGVAFWIAAFALLLMARRGMPGWGAIGVFVALPLAPILSIVAMVRGWSKYVPILLPLPFLAIAAWARLGQVPFSAGFAGDVVR